MNKQHHPNVLLTGTLRKLLGRQRSFSEKHTQLQLAGPEGWLVRPQTAGADNRPRASSGAEAREEERSDPPASWSSPTPPPSRESSRLAPRREARQLRGQPHGDPGSPPRTPRSSSSGRLTAQPPETSVPDLEKPGKAARPLHRFRLFAEQRNEGQIHLPRFPAPEGSREACVQIWRRAPLPRWLRSGARPWGWGGGGVGGLLTFGSCCSISASCSSSFSMSACSCFLLSSFSSSACWAKSKEPQGHGSGKDSHQGVLKSLPGESRRARRQREREADRPTGTPIRDSDPGFPCRSLSRLLKIQHRDVPCPEILSRGPPAPTHTLLLSLHATDADGNYPSGSSAL